MIDNHRKWGPKRGPKTKNLVEHWFYKVFVVGAGGFERPKIMFQKTEALFLPRNSCNLPE